MIRRLVKRCLFAIALLLAAPILLVVWFEKAISNSEAAFSTFAQLLSLMPGPLGLYIRAAYYYGSLESCSWQVHIGFGSLFTHRASRIAERVSTGSYCIIGHVDIAAGVRIASRVSIPSGKRQHLDDSGQLTEKTNYDRVRVGSGAWLGEGATIISNIGERTIVSAGAVVVNEMPDDSIVGGNPARVLKLSKSKLNNIPGGS